jgi:hypothetical protein
VRALHVWNVRMRWTCGNVVECVLVRAKEA